VTFATSIYGVENFLYLIMENPELAERLRDTILRAMLGIARVLDEEAGDTPDTAPHGFGFADDNCYLLSPAMYEFFGYPILKGIFDVYSPNPGDSRYQHSDSAMGHLLPLLGTLNLTGVNFGPTVTVSEIRAHLPNARIDGQLAPFTFSRNDEEGILAEFLRDFTMAQERRGLLVCTAGSINNGSRLTGMRLLMSAIQRWGKYEGE
jgi:uroporphyrinogen decarboxylase